MSSSSSTAVRVATPSLPSGARAMASTSFNFPAAPAIGGPEATYRRLCRRAARRGDEGWCSRARAVEASARNRSGARHAAGRAWLPPAGRRPAATTARAGSPAPPTPSGGRTARPVAACGACRRAGRRAIDLGAVVEGGRDGLAAREQPRRAVEAGQRRIEADPRGAERERRAARNHVAHRRRVPGCVALRERLGRGTRGRRVVQDGVDPRRSPASRRRRPTRPRSLRRRFGMLQRFGVADRPIGLQAASNCRLRLFLDIGLREQRRPPRQPARRSAARRVRSFTRHRMVSVRVCPAAIVTRAVLPSP